MDRIRILLADDHTLFRDTLKQFLNAQSDLQVIDEAGTADVALRKAKDDCPQIILLDIAMPGPSGISIVPQLHEICPDSRVVIVTEHDEPSYLRAAFAAGASGYVLKTSSANVLLDAIRRVRDHERFVDPSLREVDTGGPAKPGRSTAAPVARLSERERQVLKLLAKGLRYQDIAKRLGVTVKTVETYRSRLKAKLGFTSREDMVRIALESGVLAAGDGPTGDSPT